MHKHGIQYVAWKGKHRVSLHIFQLLVYSNCDSSQYKCYINFMLQYFFLTSYTVLHVYIHIQ